MSKKYYHVPCYPYWVSGDSPKYEIESVKPNWRCSPVVRYDAANRKGGRRRTVRVRTQMYKYALETGFCEPPKSMTANVFYDGEGVMYVPGYIRGGANAYVYGYMVYFDNGPVFFETVEAYVYGTVNDRTFYHFTGPAHNVVFFGGMLEEYLRSYALAQFYRFYEFPTNDAGNFDFWKRERMMNHPNYWKAEVVKEAVQTYYGFESSTRTAYIEGKNKIRREQEEVAKSCLSSRKSAQENHRQLRALGFVA